MSLLRSTAFVRLSQRLGSMSAVATSEVGALSCLAGNQAASGTRYASSAAEAGPENRREGKVLHPALVNPAIVKAEYAVRGELLNRAVSMDAEGRSIIYTNGANG